MKHRPAFTVASLRRAVRGAKSAGMDVSRIEIEPDGKIIVITDREAPPEDKTDFDKWMAKRARTS